jgi:hypothetical protein
LGRLVKKEAGEERHLSHTGDWVIFLFRESFSRRLFDRAFGNRNSRALLDGLGTRCAASSLQSYRFKIWGCCGGYGYVVVFSSFDVRFMLVARSQRGRRCRHGALSIDTL